MEHTNVLSKYLQSININYITVIEMCEQAVDILKDMRTDTEFHKIWIQVIKVTGENNIEPPKLPRKRIPQKYDGGENGPENLPVEQYYRINIYFTVFDIIIKEMEICFKENQLQILNGLKNLIINNCSRSQAVTYNQCCLLSLYHSFYYHKVLYLLDYCSVIVSMPLMYNYYLFYLLYVWHCRLVPMFIFCCFFFGMVCRTMFFSSFVRFLQ